MAYGRKYKSRRSFKKASAVSRVKRARPSASNQKHQIVSLAKQVNLNTRKLGQRTEKCYFERNWDVNVSTNYSAANIPLIGPNNATVIPPGGSQLWSPLWGVSENATEATKLHVSYMKLDFHLSPNNEQALIDFTVFLVSPRNKKTWDETSGMTVLSNVNDYHYNNGITLMNPKRFIIHKVWKCETSGIMTRVNSLTTTTNVMNATKIARKSYGHKISRTIQNSTGTWEEIDNDEIPITMNLNLIAFNNNSSVDVENPNFKGTALFTAYPN